MQTPEWKRSDLLSIFEMFGASFDVLIVLIGQPVVIRREGKELPVLMLTANIRVSQDSLILPRSSSLIAADDGMSTSVPIMGTVRIVSDVPIAIGGIRLEWMTSVERRGKRDRYELPVVSECLSTVVTQRMVLQKGLRE